MNNKVEITYKKINELTPNPNNPRKNDEAVEYVANSIKEFGFRNPLIIDEKNMIWCGNTRYKASLKLGLEEIPCIVVKDLTEAQIKAFSLADNKVSEFAEWDNKFLNMYIEELNTDIDMGIFGFNVETMFSIDDLEYIEGYDYNNDDREYFNKTFTFPVKYKKEIISYLKKNQDKIIKQIIKDSKNND